MKVGKFYWFDPRRNVQSIENIKSKENIPFKQQIYYILWKMKKSSQKSRWNSTIWPSIISKSFIESGTFFISLYNEYANELRICHKQFHAISLALFVPMSYFERIEIHTLNVISDRRPLYKLHKISITALSFDSWLRSCTLIRNANLFIRSHQTQRFLVKSFRFMYNAIWRIFGPWLKIEINESIL